MTNQPHKLVLLNHYLKASEESAENILPVLRLYLVTVSHLDFRAVSGFKAGHTDQSRRKKNNADPGTPIISGTHLTNPEYK